MTVRVAVVPQAPAILVDAVRAGGGEPSSAYTADAIIWTDPRDAEGLRSTLAASPARWVQLPFAGIEGFADAGLIGPRHIWTCAKGIYGEATAEQALALILSAARRLHRHARRVSWWDDVEGHRRLRGTTALIVGTGGIGSSLASMLRPMGVRILASNRSGTAATWAERTLPSSSLIEAVPEADWIVVAAALTPESEGLIDHLVIAAMKPDAWLVNVARGGLVDTEALVAALEAGRIGGAALDVTDPEPLPEGHPLWKLEDVIITSHTANTRQMAIPELAALVRRNVKRYAEGRPLEGLVDTTLGY